MTTVGIGHADHRMGHERRPTGWVADLDRALGVTASGSVLLSAPIGRQLRVESCSILSAASGSRSTRPRGIRCAACQRRCSRRRRASRTQPRAPLPPRDDLLSVELKRLGCRLRRRATRLIAITVLARGGAVLDDLVY
jgi:hypothetical protein